MAFLGWFDGELRPDAWFDAELQKAGWFDTEIIDTAGGGGGINVALTGQSQTVSAGSLTPVLALALSGQVETYSSGSLTSNLNKAISGLGYTDSQGNLVANIVAFLSGQVETYTQGSVTPDTGFFVALTGQSEVGAQGTVIPALTVSLVGNGETLAQGSFAVTRSVAVSGQSEAISQTALAVSLVKQITGQSEADSQGNVTALQGSDAQLIGQFETYSLGFLGVVNESVSAPYSGEVTLTRKRIYVKRGKQYLIFNNNEEADSYLVAEEAIEAAKKSSRGAAKRKSKALKVVKPEIVAEPKLDELSLLLAKFNVNYDLLELQKNNDIEALYHIQSMLYEMQQDEEDIELLLMAAYS